MNGRKTAVKTAAAPAAVGPYSQAVRAGGWIFLSGQIALDPALGRMVEGGVGAQTRQVLKNLEAVLRECGRDLRDVVKTTVFLTDLSHFAEMNAAYAEAFPDPAPARATVEVSALPKGALVEIEAIAREG